MKRKLILSISLLMLSLPIFSQSGTTETRNFQIVPQWIALEIERELAELDSIRVEYYFLIREHEKCITKLEAHALISAGLTDSIAHYHQNITKLQNELTMVNLRKQNAYLKYRDLQDIQSRKELKNYRKADERKLHVSVFLNLVLVVLIVLGR